MKLYVDDKRPCPEGWTLAPTFDEALGALASASVTHVDLDWNLGQGRERTGLALLLWLESAVRSGRVPLPEIEVHTGDCVAHGWMTEVAERLRA